ncbi:MAG: translation initiation factor IF-2 [Desulfarculus sp.]|nr:translation initiation factor IF-2 [Pseudomonadota bacterium]MBV1717760.1 translation initiation factor IF-2 [Desulfarculus sp.]MBU4575137.1 translation initiation factor IF-2 [Pseudomonadota bacterium]MBU4596758.1 translation initiation factor IF-2 [Pseudomonadota bacterium]MBV1740474.1 translation initiation factor IF-2 [Desulfarculus sp.]
MAKMRVYELAKELKIDNRDLIRQLIEMGLDVRNHMSALSPEDAQIVRDKLKAERSEVVEEKRVTTRVIRRRRKKVETAEDAASEGLDEPAEEEFEEPQAQAAPEAPVAQAPPAAEAQAPEEPPAEVQAVAEPEPEPEAPVKASIHSEPQAQPEPKAEAQPEPVQEPEPAPKAEAAPEPGPEPEPTPEPEAEEQPTPEPEPAPEPKKEPTPVAEAEAKPAPEPAPEPKKAVAEKKEPQERPRPQKAKVVRPKRSMEDTPARIISKPAAPVAPMGDRWREDTRPAPPAARRPARPAPGAPPAVGDVPPPDKADGRPSRRRKKGKKGSPIPNDDVLMRKAGSKRKEILDRDALYGGRPSRGRRRGGGTVKKSLKTELTTPKAIKRRVKVTEAITVGDLAKRMGVKAAEVVGRMMKMGMMVTLNQALDTDDAGIVAAEFGFEIERVGFEEEGLLAAHEDRPEEMEVRPPVVTIMGHVDHGKTSLLDSIRNANVVDGEAGGITQHIGAYDVHLPSGGHVVFLDTPGHEAFTQMRARGSQVTDVVVLVVAADDGIMEQTKEAISHSKAAGVPILVAINKIDKPGADPERVRRELSERGLVSESWGGDTITVEVSAKTGQGVDELLEMLQLQSEVLELTANPHKPARGHVLEAHLDKGRGPVGTILVQEGTLKAGDSFVCGSFAGKVRSMLDDRGKPIDKAGPSIPVEVQGFGGVPEAGDEFTVVETEKVARQIADHRAIKRREAELSAQTKTSLEGFFEKMAEGETQELKLVVKADVQGSVEALVESLNKLGNDEVKVNVIHAATGAINESDVMLASTSDAIVIGFNVRPMGKVSETAEAERVDIRTYEVIYHVLEEVTAALTGMLAPLYKEEVIGRVVVRETFGVPKVGTVAGSYVTEGRVTRGAQVRLLREGVVIANTKVSSLRRFKDDVKEVAQGFECGVGLENYNDIKVGDEIEFYVIHEVAAEL